MLYPDETSAATCITGNTGAAGANAKSITITSNNGQIFKKAKGESVFTPAQITLTATLAGGLTSYQ